jgi:DNA-binding transcriptional LysR family regulator
MALRRGEIDLALTYLGSDFLSHDFYTRKVATVPSLAVLALNHRLASQTQISISELKNEHFLRVPDTCAPGYNQKISQFCVQFGKFRPRFAAMRNLTSFAEGLSLSANEDEISLIRFLFPTSGYRMSSWSPLPIRAQPGICLLPGNEARPPARCALCWTRLLLNLADLHSAKATSQNTPILRALIGNWCRRFQTVETVDSIDDH